MVKVKITLKKLVMPRTAYFHSFITAKYTMDVQHLRMERVTFVQQRLTQIATWLIGQFAINVANMTRTVSFIFHTSIFIIIFVHKLVTTNSFLGNL